MLITIIIFIVILTILVLIHEAGHFFVARKFGIKVEEFGVGLPPRAWGKKIGETIYSINWLPVGGFVKLYGEDEAGGGKISIKSHPSTSLRASKSRNFASKPAWQRALVVVAGVVMNFILAVVVISYIFTQGVVVPTGVVKIDEIMPGSPAESANLQAGDVILEVDSQSVHKISEVQKNIQGKVEEEVKLKIKRADKIQDLSLKTKKEVADGRTIGIIGVRLADSEKKYYPWYQAPFYGTVEALRLSWLTLSGLVGMLGGWIIHGSVPQDVAGPVGVAQITGEAIKVGLNALFFYIALLSLNLAILNVLPIPALDGGRLFFILIELVSGKRVNPHIERYAHTIGMVILLALIALITLRDISRIASGQSILPLP